MLNIFFSEFVQYFLFSKVICVIKDEISYILFLFGIDKRA